MSIPTRIPEGKIVLTYEDYLESPVDGKRYEILEVYLLDAESYRLTVTLQGDTPQDVAPFTALKLTAKEIFS